MRGYLGGVIHFDSRSVDHLGEIVAAGRFYLAAGIITLHQLFFIYFCCVDLLVS